MTLALAILIQALPQSQFTTYLREAEARLGLKPHEVMVVDRPTAIDSCVGTDGEPCAAWVRNCTGPCPTPEVSVLNTFLIEAPPPVLQYTAYHEACHLFMGTRRIFDRNQLPMVESMTDTCVRETLGEDHYHDLVARVPTNTQWPVQLRLYWERLRRYHDYWRMK